MSYVRLKDIKLGKDCRLSQYILLGDLIHKSNLVTLCSVPIKLPRSLIYETQVRFKIEFCAKYPKQIITKC